MDNKTLAAMNLPSFDEFSIRAQDEGFDDVLERRWPPLTVLETHSHPFALKALVVQGEMWLTVGDETRHLQAGDSFALERDIAHAERYGTAGASYWVARRN